MGVLLLLGLTSLIKQLQNMCFFNLIYDTEIWTLVNMVINFHVP
jgi:hypothetical protein